MYPAGENVRIMESAMKTGICVNARKDLVVIFYFLVENMT